MTIVLFETYYSHHPSNRLFKVTLYFEVHTQLHLVVETFICLELPFHLHSSENIKNFSTILSSVCHFLNNSKYPRFLHLKIATSKLLNMNVRGFMWEVFWLNRQIQSDNFTSNHYFENQEYLVINHCFRFPPPICIYFICLFSSNQNIQLRDAFKKNKLLRRRHWSILIYPLPPLPEWDK